MLKVNEIFYSLQGEGGRAGAPSIFVRLSGCDLTCGFCDTEFVSGKDMSLDNLLAVIKSFPCRWIVWTGGEPALQLTAEIVGFFKDKGFSQAIETNGNNKLPDGLDYICISPKVAEHVLAKNFKGKTVQELRYVRHNGQLGVPKPALLAEKYYLSPMFNGNKIDVENLKHCIELCKGNPPWNLSIQMHKLLKIL